MLNWLLRLEDIYRNTNNNPYGHLLDKYLEAGVYEMEIMEEFEEKNARYGDLLEKGKAAEEQSRIRMMERIERKEREEQERIDKNAAFVERIFAKKKEHEEAEADRLRKEREEAERLQKYLDGVQRLVDIREDVPKRVARTKAMLERNAQKRREHEEKMRWFE